MTDSLSILSANFVFSGLDKSFLQDVAKECEFIKFPRGDYIFHRGDEVDAIYIVINGSLETSTEWNNERIVLHQVNAGDAVGLISITGNNKRLVNAQAREDIELLRIDKASILSLTDSHHEAIQLLDQKTKELLTRTQLRLALRISRLFKDLDEKTLRALELEMQIITAPCNTVLCNEGESSRDLYIVISGRLQIAKLDKDGNQNVVGDVTVGESVGEIGVITDQSRAATVKTIRDTTYASLSRDSYYALLKIYPLELNRSFTTSIVNHLTSDQSERRDTPHTFAIVSLSEGINLKEISEQLASAFDQYGRTMQLDATTCDQSMGKPGVSQASFEDENNNALLQWMAEQEMAHSQVLYITTAKLDNWTKRCLRQADHILFIALSDDDNSIKPFEKEILDEPWVKAAPSTLLLIHADDNQPNNTISWLRRRNLSHHFHIRHNNHKDYGRVVRFLTHRAIGLVLGGGGARGFAHIGVIRALRELGIPIDLVGGNSMGAIIAAQCALQWEWQEMIEQTSILCRAGDEFTLPMVSLLKGSRLVQGIRRMYGDINIEDMWFPFYSISCNLSRASVMVHDTGRLSESVIYSNSPPGLLPPRVLNGDLLVDGALLNNTPVDVMREQHGRSTIIAVDVSPKEEMFNNTGFDEGISGWKILLNKINPLARSVNFPGIQDILYRASIIGGIAQQNKGMEGIADIYMKPPVGEYSNIAYQHGRHIAEVGYEYTMEQARSWEKTELG